MIADNDVDERSFQLGVGLGVIVGLLFGVLFGVLRWRTEAVQVEECKVTLTQVARFHESCNLNLSYERANPVCPAASALKTTAVIGGR